MASREVKRIVRLGKHFRMECLKLVQVDGALVPCLERKLPAGADAGRPAPGHHLDLGVEAQALHARKGGRPENARPRTDRLIVK